SAERWKDVGVESALENFEQHALRAGLQLVLHRYNPVLAKTNPTIGRLGKARRRKQAKRHISVESPMQSPYRSGRQGVEKVALQAEMLRESNNVECKKKKFVEYVSAAFQRLGLQCLAEEQLEAVWEEIEPKTSYIGVLHLKIVAIDRDDFYSIEGLLIVTLCMRKEGDHRVWVAVIIERGPLEGHVKDWQYITLEPNADNEAELDEPNEEDEVGMPLYVGHHDALSDALCVGDNFASNTAKMEYDFYILRCHKPKHIATKAMTDSWENCIAANTYVVEGHYYENLG
ncbi:hypothetical protein L7F22_065276, partial [Adiantum nelumboides]|nr:hypothetical protein [Adiantum nelumboides]